MIVVCCAVPCLYLGGSRFLPPVLNLNYGWDIIALIMMNSLQEK